MPKIERTFETDKKLNSAYWDEIDGRIEEMVKEIASFSTSEVDDDMLMDGVADIRETTIKFLKEIGGTFPYVEGNL